MDLRYLIKPPIVCTIIIAILFSVRCTHKNYIHKTLANKKNISIDTGHKMPFFLVISDIHLHIEKKQSDISNKEGDTGYDLWDSAKAEIRRILALPDKPAFVLILGDITRHQNDKTKEDSINVHQNFTRVVKYFKDAAAAIPLIYIAGNNDSWNGDYSRFYVPDTFYQHHEYPILNFGEIAADNSMFADTTHLQEGYYSVYPMGKKSGLRVIALNTVMLTRERKHPYSNDTNATELQNADGLQQITWLEEQLKMSAKLSEHVLIAMHVPPSFDSHALKNMWYDVGIQKKFVALVNNYRYNIAGLLAGHTHMDGIRLFRDSGNVTALMLSVPGIAVGHGNNPAVKIISFDKNDFALDDFTTVYMNYWNNSNAAILPGWDSLYSFKNLMAPGNISMLQYFKNNQDNNPAIQGFINKIYTVRNSNNNATDSFFNISNQQR